MLSAIRRHIPASLSHLMLSRVVDQGVMAAAALLLARHVGPTAFAPVAGLLVVNSLAIQVSDFGLGFAVLRSRPDVPIAFTSLHRLRVVGLVVVVVGSVAGLAIGGGAGPVVVAGAWLWALSAEAYVRKAAGTRLNRTAEVARAEIAGACVVAVSVGVLVATDLPVEWFGAALVLKHVLEIATVRHWRSCFRDGGESASSGGEWLGQVLSYGVANIDYLVVGVLLSPAEFSTYVLAFRMASALPALLGNPITQVAFVELADAEGERRETARRRLLRRARSVGLLGGVVVLAAAPLLPVLLGPAWSGTGWLVAVLAPAVPFRLMLGTAVATVITLGRAWQLARWEFARLLVVGLAAVVGAAIGLVPAAALVSMTTIVSLTWVHRRASVANAESPPRWEWVAAAIGCGAVALIGVVAELVS